jgi:superfamily I DNA and RNA helicase
VTVSNVYRAKGNETWKVYVTRVHLVGWPNPGRPRELEVQRRNEVGVAFTRSRLWCVAVGQEGPILDELRDLADQYPQLTFLAFNKRAPAFHLHDDDIEDTEDD